MGESFFLFGTCVTQDPLRLLPFEAKVIMFLQPIAEHAVMWLTCFSCPPDPEAEIKTKIQKNLKSKKKKGQSESYMLQARK